MKTTTLLHNLGQCLWLDNITRDLLDSGTLKSYIDELSVTGLTSESQSSRMLSSSGDTSNDTQPFTPLSIRRSIPRRKASAAAFFLSDAGINTRKGD